MREPIDFVPLNHALAPSGSEILEFSFRVWMLIFSPFRAKARVFPAATLRAGMLLVSIRIWLPVARENHSLFSAWQGSTRMTSSDKLTNLVSLICVYAWIGAR
jgi:hypothetical protein